MKLKLYFQKGALNIAVEKDNPNLVEILLLNKKINVNILNRI